MHPFFKNPLAVLSALCWFVIACLAVSVMLNTRTIESIDAGQNRMQSEREQLKRDIAQAREDTAEIAQRQADDAQKMQQSITELRDEVNTLRQTVDANRAAAEKATAALQAAVERAKPVTFANARSVPSAHGIHFNGNGGRDTVNGWKPLLYLDGSLLVSVEIFNLADGRRNEVRVMAPGLNGLEEDFMELRLDPALDTVVLDRCLQWKKDGAPVSEALQKQFTATPDAYIWTATDADGKTRRVAITGGADVKVADTCDNDYSAQVAARDAWEKSVPKPKLPDDAPAHLYQPDAAAGAQTYREWAAATKNTLIKDALTLIAAMVQAEKLPPEFMTGKNLIFVKGSAYNQRVLRLLPLDPKLAPLRDMEKDYNCKMPRGEFQQILSLLGNNISVACTTEDSLRINSDGLQVLLTGKGYEKIDSLTSVSSLVILHKNWGSKTIQKTCRAPDVQRDEMMFRQLPTVSTYAGIGLRLADNGKGAVSAGAMHGSPAEKAGIVLGDHILSINGEPLPPALADVVARIRGEAGTSLVLGIETAGGEKRDITLQREKIIDTGTPSPRIRIDYKWPYEFGDFILFGPDIRQDDMIEETPGKWRNTKTGDTLEISPCFNFVFSE